MERLMLLDGYGLVYRGYYALPPLTTSRGELVNGVFGFASIVLRGLQDLQPDYLAVSFDLPGPTFRHEQYAEYKATRQRMPDDLRDQFPKVREVVKALRIPVYEMPGFEADDVIGTITKKLEGNEGLETTIVTVDLDMLQLVTPRVRLMTTRSGVENTVMYDVARIDERFGLRPDQMVDYKALKGDPTDNIPGVPGVGEKTAAKLIREFGSLDEMFARIDEVTPEKLRDKLREHFDQIQMGRELSRIVRDLPVELDLEAARLGDYDRDTVVRLFREYEFRTLIERLPADGRRICRAALGEPAVVAESGYVPAARVAGRPEGWGPGRTTRAARRVASCSSALDFDAVAGPAAGDGADRWDRAVKRSRAFEPADDLPSALAAAIIDPGRIEVRGADRIDDLEPWLVAQPAVGVSLLLDDPRPRRGTPLALAVAGTDGRVVAADGAEAADALRRLLERLGTPLVGHEVKPLIVARFADDPASDVARDRVRHADRRVCPQRRAPQPDDPGRRRGEPRPDPPAGHGPAGHGPRRPRGAVSDRSPRTTREAPGGGRTGAAVPRYRAAADPGARPDGGSRCCPRSRGVGGPGPGVRRRDLPARAGDLRRRRSRVQPRQPQAARADPVLRAEPAQGQAHEDRLLDGRVRARGAAAGPPDDRQAPRMAHLHEAALDVRRGACRR